MPAMQSRPAKMSRISPPLTAFGVLETWVALPVMGREPPSLFVEPPLPPPEPEASLGCVSPLLPELPVCVEAPPPVEPEPVELDPPPPEEPEEPEEWLFPLDVPDSEEPSERPLPPDFCVVPPPR